MTTIYCEATHPKSPDGCYESPEHEGQHRGIRSGYGQDYTEFFWEDEKEPAETFTDEELAILITALQPVQQFFPDLMAKITAAREAGR